MTDLLLYQDGVFLYLTLFLLLMGGAIGLPIPEDIPLILAGIVAHRGNGKIEILFIVCYVAIILGDLLIFAVGRRFGPKLFKTAWFSKRVPPNRIRRVRKGLEKRSIMMIFIARHLFYLRTMTFLTCGAVKMSPLRFFLADAAAALISAPLMMWLGYTGADQIDSIISSHKKTNFISLSIGVILILVLVLFYIKKKKSFEVEDSGEESNSPNGASQ